MRPRLISSGRAGISSAECGDDYLPLICVRVSGVPVLMRFQRFRTFVFLIPDSSVGTAPHLILELVGLQIVMRFGVDYWPKNCRESTLKINGI